MGKQGADLRGLGQQVGIQRCNPRRNVLDFLAQSNVQSTSRLGRTREDAGEFLRRDAVLPAEIVALAQGVTDAALCGRSCKGLV